MEILFKDIIVIGEGAWTPSQGFVRQDVDDSSKVREHENNIIEGQDDFSCNPSFDTSCKRDGRRIWLDCKSFYISLMFDYDSNM